MTHAHSQSNIFKKATQIGELVTKLGSIVALALVCLNAYLAYQLVPFASDLDKTKFRVSAIEQQTGKLASQQSVDELGKKLEQRDNDIIHRLDTISTRLDRVIIK